MIVLLAALLFSLAFLSGAEAAILSANRLRAKHRAELGEAGGKAVYALQARKQDFLPAILALETLLTVLISTLGTALAQGLRPGTQSLFVSALLITLFILTLGEIIPKTIATHNPDRFAYWAAPILLPLTRILSRLLHPLTWTLGLILGLMSHESTHGVPTETELKYLISLSREHGVLQKEEEELLQNIFDFTDSRVGEIMVPRTQIVSLEEDAELTEAIDQFSRTPFSRFPIQRENLDHVIGILNMRDVLVAMARGKKSTDVKEFIQPAVFVPESKRVGKLLQEMRDDHFQFAMIIDEYGGTAGLVTLTDLLEEIVGTLEKQPAKHPIRPIDEKNLVVPASTRIEELEERLGVAFAADGIQTVGGFVFGLFGRVPEEGEQIRYQNIRFTVTQKQGYRIHQVMITKEGP